MEDYIGSLLREITTARHLLTEEAVESAIQGGEHGVMVIDSGVEYFHVEVSPLVPYGRMVQFPSRDAVDRWILNGMPL